MIVIKLKDAMLAYGRRVGFAIRYEHVAELTGIPLETVRSIGGRPGYHCPLDRVEVLCRALGVPLHDMLEMIDTPPEAEDTGENPKSKKKPAKKVVKKDAKKPTKGRKTTKAPKKTKKR